MKVEQEQAAMKDFLDKERKKIDSREMSERSRMGEREKRLQVSEQRKKELDKQMARTSYGRPGAFGVNASGQADDMKHRHVHHHIHYHDGDQVDGDKQDGDNGSFEEEARTTLPQKLLSQEEQRRMERESEERSKLHAGGNAHSNQMARTIESFAPHVNAALRRSASAVDFQAHSRQMTISGQQHQYARNIQQAVGAYADPGRPRNSRNGANHAWS